MSFKSVLVKIGEDFKKGLLAILPWAETAGEVAVAEFAPALGPAFNATVSVVSMVEQKYAALGKQSGTGASKLSDALQIGEPLIAQALADVGKAHDTAAVTKFINEVVDILNAAPAKA
jgi:hypothetical protein